MHRLLFLLLIFALVAAACAPAATPTPTPLPPTAEPTEEATAEAVAEPTEEATEVAAEPTEEVAEPTEEATEVAAEPTEEATEVAAEPTEEATEVAAEPTEEVTEEPTPDKAATGTAVAALIQGTSTASAMAVQATATAASEARAAAAAAEVTEEAAVEATEEATEEVAEPTEEATEEVVMEEATEEAAVEATAEPPAAAEEFVFGMVLVGFKNDAGWSQAHYEGGLYVQEKIPGSRMVFVENINGGNTEVPFESAIAELVDQGAKLIFTTSDEHEEDTSKIAPEYPDVTFVNISGDDTYTGEAPENVGNLMGTMEWGKLVAGCAAALTTETGKIGYLGPLINFETRRLAASAYLGARYCYEKYAGGDPAELQFTVTWIGFWFNIPGVTLDPLEVSTQFFNEGNDVVISGIDTTEALTVAGQRAAQGEKVWAVPYDFRDACNAAPEVCLGVPYFNWGAAYVDVVSAVQAGTYQPEFKLVGPDWEDINNLDTTGIGFIVGPALSEEDQESLDAFIAEMTAFATDSANEGNIFLWVGPLAYQDGTEIAAEGEALPFIAPLGEKPSIWYLDQLLEGMSGASKQE
jgi:simple sugar transport system substrate-binding protein